MMTIQTFFHSMKDFSFQEIRNHHEKKKCGYRKDVDLPKVTFPEFEFVAVTESELAQRKSRKRKRGQNKKKYGVKHINYVLLKKTQKSHQNVWKGKDIEVSDADRKSVV